MHHLYTTDAYVLGSMPHGESNRVYRLFTRTLGFVYVHGQGVRELKNRNRYALATGSYARVTLVRGREMWRLTGAVDRGAVPVHGQARQSMRKVLALVGKLLPVEDATPRLFTILEEGFAALRVTTDESIAATEALIVLHVLHERGYVPAYTSAQRGLPSLAVQHAFSRDALTRATRHHAAIVNVVNNALRNANG